MPPYLEKKQTTPRVFLIVMIVRRFFSYHCTFVVISFLLIQLVFQSLCMCVDLWYDRAGQGKAGRTGHGQNAQGTNIYYYSKLLILQSNVVSFTFTCKSDFVVIFFSFVFFFRS